MPDAKQLAGYSKDFLQGASNAAASNISAPVDALAWILRQGGLDIQDPVGGEDWMRRQGLTAAPQNETAGRIGEQAGSLVPVAVGAKLKEAKQLAELLRQPVK